MVLKSGAGAPKSLSDGQFAKSIAAALQQELGGSRRASKTIMTWTGVTDHTARAWLNGRKSPSSLHLLKLAGCSREVMSLVLRLTGYDRIGLGINLEVLEVGLVEILDAVRALRAAEERSS